MKWWLGGGGAQHDSVREKRSLVCFPSQANFKKCYNVVAVSGKTLKIMIWQLRSLCCSVEVCIKMHEKPKDHSSWFPVQANLKKI